jgi:hypothetical protein
VNEVEAGGLKNKRGFTGGKAGEFLSAAGVVTDFTWQRGRLGLYSETPHVVCYGWLIKFVVRC